MPSYRQPVAGRPAPARRCAKTPANKRARTAVGMAERRENFLLVSHKLLKSPLSDEEIQANPRVPNPGSKKTKGGRGGVAWLSKVDSEALPFPVAVADRIGAVAAAAFARALGDFLRPPRRGFGERPLRHLRQKAVRVRAGGFGGGRRACFCGHRSESAPRLGTTPIAPAAMTQAGRRVRV